MSKVKDEKRGIGEKLSSTKFLLGLVGLLVIGALLWFGKLTAGQFLIGFGVCVGGYKVANVLLTTLMPGIIKRNGSVDR